MVGHQKLDKSVCRRCPRQHLSTGVAQAKSNRMMKFAFLTVFIHMFQWLAGGDGGLFARCLSLSQQQMVHTLRMPSGESE